MNKRQGTEVVEIDEDGTHGSLEDNAWRIAVLLAVLEGRILQNIGIAVIVGRRHRRKVLSCKGSKPRFIVLFEACNTCSIIFLLIEIGVDHILFTLVTILAEMVRQRECRSFGERRQTVFVLEDIVAPVQVDQLISLMIL